MTEVTIHALHPTYHSFTRCSAGCSGLGVGLNGYPPQLAYLSEYFQIEQSLTSLVYRGLVLIQPVMLSWSREMSRWGCWE